MLRNKTICANRGFFFYIYSYPCIINLIILLVSTFLIITKIISATKQVFWYTLLPIFAAI